MLMVPKMAPEIEYKMTQGYNGFVLPALAKQLKPFLPPLE